MEDIIDIKSTKLSKGHKIYIAAVFFIFGSLSISINYAALRFFLSTYTVHPILIVLMLVDLNITWMLFWNIILLLFANAFIISKEFQKCISEFEIGLSSNGSIFSDIFHEAINRFRKLKSIVNKEDSMFSFTVGILLYVELSTMCSDIYIMVISEIVELWYITAVSCGIALALLLISLSDLNYQVRHFKFLKCGFFKQQVNDFILLVFFH